VGGERTITLENPLREKVIIVLICIFGLLAVSYGMFKDNNLVFIIGILLTIGGYLLIRRKLKASIRDKS
jgi:LPXTG-motif cell wall-anchored protein